MKVLRALVISMLVATAACHSYQTHPGSVNTADSAVYDALLIAETTIDAARPTIQALPSTSPQRAAFAALVTSYNSARIAWLTYRGAVATKDKNTDQFLTAMQSATAQLSATVTAFKGAKQ